MTLFSSDLGERLLSSLNSTGRDSLNDLGADQDEKDRIILNASKSVEPIDLRVDYSDFKNHIFFNSAYTSVNLAYSRIFNDYPTDGTYRDFFEWQRINNGYENWFFDNFPKQQGFINLTSGTNGPSVVVQDYENKLNIPNIFDNLTASITVEFILKPYENIQTLNPIFYIHDNSKTSGILAYLENKNSTKWLTVETIPSGTNTPAYMSFSVEAYVSSSNHYAIISNTPPGQGAAGTNGIGYQQTILYVNGVAVASGSFNSGTYNGSPPYNNFYYDINQPQINIGYYASGNVDCYFSGAIDEFRVWNSDRSSFIAKNYFKTIFANPSGGLQVYYRFNEVASYGNKIIDYSGNNLHGNFSGNFSLTNNRASGTLGGWFKDDGDPIFDSANDRVVSFLTDQQNSGSIFDQTNRNYIFNIVPSFFVDNEDADNQKLFLLLLARHYDKLKLYIEHLSNIHNTALDSSNDTPNQLMNLVAQNYGVDIGDVYDSSDPLSLYFGEGVLGSGSLDSSVEIVKNQLKRNVLNNLIYLLKTKSTREALESALFALGVDTDTININEYSLFSGGIETNRHNVVSECRVANFNTASTITVNGSGISAQTTSCITQQLSFLLSSGTANLTSSILSFFDSGSLTFYLQTIRENANSISGTFSFTFADSGSAYRTLTSSLFPLYNNKWTDVTLTTTFSGTNKASVPGNGFFASQLDYDQLINQQFVFTSSIVRGITFASSLSDLQFQLGTSGTNYFSGYMHEYKIWDAYSVSGNLDLVKKWHLDYNSTELQDFNLDINKLLLRFKLNDFTSSATTSGVVHDYIVGFSGNYTNFTTSSYYNFPGQFLSRYVQSYSYDINTNNDKIRIKNQSTKLKPNEQTKDIPFVSVDVSPVVSLNKEIINYFGDLTKFNNIIGQPYNKYRDHIKLLNVYKNSFFNNKINSKIDFKAYINLIKWLDNNFTTLLNQFIPLDMISSISNFTIEPGIFDYNKVKYEFPYLVNKSPTVLTSSMSARPRMTASNSISLLPGDPGRFGAAASASANYPTSMNFSASFSSSSGVNFRNLAQRNIAYISMSNNYNNVGPNNFYYSSSNNNFYSKIISSSNYLRDVLNVNTDFFISASNIEYGTTGTYAPLTNVFWTGTLNAIQDQRWLWAFKRPASGIPLFTWDGGIGYGGGWGQMYNTSKKSYSTPATTNLNTIFSATFTQQNQDSIKYFDNEDDNRKVVILWPNESSYNGINLFYDSTNGGNAKFEDGTLAASFGSIVELKDYETLNFEILGNYSDFTGSKANAVVPQITFQLRFQFFENQISADGFELIPSGTNSYTSGQITQYQTTFGEHYYTLLPKTSVSWQLNFTRPLPSHKYMRIYLTPIWVGGTNNTYVNILVKGTLSKNKMSTLPTYKEGLV